MVRDYHARGKLLLTGEYVVMQGATALACPTRRGQSMYIAPYRPACIHWKAFTPRGEVWLEAEWNWLAADRKARKEVALPLLEMQGFRPLKLMDLHQKGTRTEAAVSRLESWLTKALMLSHQTSPELYHEQADRVMSEGFSVETYLEFEREWGLGSSSSLISLLAQWWGCRPMELHAATQGGSGYDQACATVNGPILYQLMGAGVTVKSGHHLQSDNLALQEKFHGANQRNRVRIESQTEGHHQHPLASIEAPVLRPHIQPVSFLPSFHDHLLFVYTGKKQSTDHSIQQFWSRSNAKEGYLQEITDCTHQLVSAIDLKTFMEMMHRHEQIMSGLLEEEPIQTTRFAGFPGQTKSLGAWGGDFILAAAEDPDQARRFLTQKGYSVCFSLNELLLCRPTNNP